MVITSVSRRRNEIRAAPQSANTYAAAVPVPILHMRTGHHLHAIPSQY